MQNRYLLTVLRFALQNRGDGIIPRLIGAKAAKYTLYTPALRRLLSMILVRGAIKFHFSNSYHEEIPFSQPTDDRWTFSALILLICLLRIE